MMSINAAKAVEIGAGLEAAAMRGEDAADEMRLGEDGQPRLSPTIMAACSVAFRQVRSW
jgi:chorismate synthase